MCRHCRAHGSNKQKLPYMLLVITNIYDRGVILKNVRTRALKGQYFIHASLTHTLRRTQKKTGFLW